MPASITSVLVYGAQQSRRLIPPSAIPGLVRRRVDKLWVNPEFRELQEAQMRHLLEFTDRAPEIPALARRFSEEMIMKTYYRWHPRLVTREPVRGIEWLTTKRDPNRSIVLSFVHHYRYEGMFNALKQRGVDLDIMASTIHFDPTTSTTLKQHLSIVASGGRMTPAAGGTDRFIEMLKPGMVMAIAPDIPSRTKVTFLGRECRGSFGSARIACATNSQVVLITAHKDESGSYLQVHPPLEPSDFEGPRELLDEIIRRHEGPVLAWPEVFEMPRARFARLED